VVQKVKGSSIAAFTIDVEDGVSIAMRDVFGQASPQTERVVRCTGQILELLARHDAQATFFILGQVAEKFPGLVRKIAAAGHEIGVHGYDHWQFFKLTPNQAKEELTRAKQILEDVSGQAVYGHRAPAFSVIPNTDWALDVIAECGFAYDSSIVPISGRRYGWPGFPKNIVRLRTAQGNRLIEAPVSAVRIFSRELAFSGGGYLRLFPFFFTRWAFGKQTKQRPVILYLHPYELDTARYPDYYFAAMKEAPLLTQLKMRSNWLRRNTVSSKLSHLLKTYPFTTMQNVIASVSEQPLEEWQLDGENGALRKVSFD
jgi:polysaccharide deacetylase family protein (PEP-CTERM system associated)